MTSSKVSPRKEVRILDAIDINLTWLLQQVDSDQRLRFAIDRNKESCRTPRRNEEIEGALNYFERFERWCEKVHAYFTQDLFRVETGHGLNLGSINDDAVFVPVLPLFERREGRARDDAEEAGQGLVGLRVTRDGPTLGLRDLNRFLEEERGRLERSWASWPRHSQMEDVSSQWQKQTCW